jgi:hypothetical protein
VKGAAAFGLLSVSLTAWPAGGQVSFSATYDQDRRVNLHGVVIRVEWANPHAFVFIAVKDLTGTVSNWAVEVGNPLELEQNGWTRSTVRIGETVTVEAHPSRTDRRQVSATSIVSAAGTPIFVASKVRRASAARQPAPRSPEGHVSLGPPPGKKGYWGLASASGLVEHTGAKIVMNVDGLLADLGDVDRVAPFQPWARALYEHRQLNRLQDDPLARCLPPGGPRQFQMAHGFQFVEQPELGRILVLLGGGDRNWRVIHTDGRPQGQPAEVVLSYYGNSVGRWEKDTLVVDSIGFNEKFWLTNGGLPHTEALHLVERFTRQDLNTLKYEVTVDDPRTYTRPWTGGWTIEWMPDREIQEYFCEENVESTLLR